jgi:hypothetical protein
MRLMVSLSDGRAPDSKTPAGGGSSLRRLRDLAEFVIWFVTGRERR